MGAFYKIMEDGTKQPLGGPSGGGADITELEARVTALEETIGTLNEQLQAALEGRDIGNSEYS